jgi:MFS family permease
MLTEPTGGASGRLAQWVSALGTPRVGALGMSEPSAPGAYRSLMGNRNYVRVLSAGLGSTAGSAISGICLIWIVYSATASALDVGLLGAAFLAAAIPFSVFGGALADRYDRRRLMIVSDWTRAGAMAGVALVLELHGFDLLTILAANFVVGAFTTVFNPAEQAIIPALVEAPSVANANGLVRSSRSALQFLGFSAAGVMIVTIGATSGVIVNAATFALSALLLTGMRLPSAGAGSRRAPGATGYFSEIAGGFRWLLGARGFFQLTISAMFFNFCANLVGTFLVIFVTVVLHGSALVYALLLAVDVAGLGIGSLLVGPLRAERWAGRAWVVPYGIMAGGVTLAFALVPTVPIALAGVFLVGLFGGFAGTAWLTAAQLLVPSDMQGRYYGIDNLGSIAIIPVAQIGGAFLITAYGVRQTYVATAVIWVIVGLIFLIPRALWNLGYRTPEPDPTLRSGADGAGTPGSPEETRAGSGPAT